MIGRWWNGSWGRWSRKDVWVEELDDGMLEVRWRHGIDSTAARLVTDDPERVRALVRELLSDPADEWVDWIGLYPDPRDGPG